jgi:lipid A 3-O-deacylase
MSRAMKIWRTLYLGALASCYSFPANSGALEPVGPKAPWTPVPAPTPPSLISAVEETPTVSPHGNDRHYTNGIKLSYTTAPLGDRSILTAPIRWLGDSTFLFHRQSVGTDDRLEWNILGQSIFTPEKHQVSNPSLNDRPYAGWLYTGLNFIQNSDNQQLTSLEFLGGIVGPWALGRQLQNNVHALFGIRLVRGWNHQLGNELGFTVSWERKWRFNHELGGGYSWEIIPDAGVTAGNVFTFAEAGALIRWGRGLKAGWGPEMIRPGFSGTSYFSGDKAGVGFGWDVFLGTQGRVVVRNIFLDGNSFQNSRSVVKERVVADLVLGMELFNRNGFRFGFSVITRTPEFRKQRGVDNFGSFNGTYAF